MKTASAPGKVIILGEHTALYGNPVLVAALDLRSYAVVAKRADRKVSIKAPWSGDAKISKLGRRVVEHAIGLVGGRGFNIRVQSDVPIASGLGSSASISSALLMALSAEMGKKWGLHEVAKATQECEDIIHSKSSGVDPFITTFGGVGIYQSGKLRALNLKENPNLVIAHSGILRNTGAIVEELSEMRQNDRDMFDSFLARSERIVLDGKKAAEEKDWSKLGRLMDQNHELLRGLGVSCDGLDKMVNAAREAGAFGAKLSGAGRGGIMVALVDEKSKERVIKALSSMGKKIIEANISSEGARLEEGPKRSKA